MWEKIAKEMQIPWRAAENMHWQMGEIEISNRANVQPFQLAGQQPSRFSERTHSTSPPSGSAVPISMSHSQTHNHSLPQVSMPTQVPVQQITPAYSRMHHSDRSSPPNGPTPRRRADSATSVPTNAASNGNLLPPLGEVMSHSTPPSQYRLPPVVTPVEQHRR